MPRSTRKAQPAGATPRKTSARTPMTHEGIAADLEAFRGAGGKIEVLGVTRTLLRIDTEDTKPPTTKEK